jgi:BlaI family penicillinase repressor
MTRSISQHDPADLGSLEREILDLIWREGQATAENLRAALDRPLKDSTIRTVLRRLEEKGYLIHTVDERTYIYRPAETRQTVATRAARRIADWFCHGSMESLMVGIINSDTFNDEELLNLSEYVAQLRKENAR